jgi:hypothetical protein
MASYTKSSLKLKSEAKSGIFWKVQERDENIKNKISTLLRTV